MISTILFGVVVVVIGLFSKTDGCKLIFRSAPWSVFISREPTLKVVKGMLLEKKSLLVGVFKCELLQKYFYCQKLYCIKLEFSWGLRN